MAAFAVVGAGVIPVFVPYSDPGPAARYLAALQDAKTPLAILDPAEARRWVAAHPAGQLITVERSRYDGKGAAVPEYQAPSRGAWVQVRRGAALLVARPELR